MRTPGWALTSIGLLMAGFVAMWIVDASMPQAYNLSDPQIWLGAVLLGGAGLGALASYRDAESRSVLLGVGLGALGFALVLVGFYLLVGSGTPVTLSVQETPQQKPVTSLDPNETYQRAPELAQALDDLAASNRSEIVLNVDTDTFDRIQTYLNQGTGDYTDPFSWKGMVARIHASRV